MLKRLAYISCFFFVFAIQTENTFAFVQEPDYERAFEDNFKERYSSDKYNYEGKERTYKTIGSNSPMGEHAEYENEKPKLKEESDKQNFEISGGFINFIFIGILIAAVGYLAFILLSDGGQGLFVSGKSRKLKSFDITSDNIQDTDVESLIANAENAQEFRLAIRFYYLLVLKTLSLKNLIKLEDDKTDSDYLGEIAQHPVKDAFAQAAYVYKYTWYGEFDVNQSQYQIAKRKFDNLLNSVKR